MEHTADQDKRREEYVLASIQATLPLQAGLPDRQVTLQLLIEAAESLKQHLTAELQELREEFQAD